MNFASPHTSRSRWHRTVAIIFVMALLIRVGFVFSLQDGFYFPDSLDYSASAMRLIGDGEFGDTFRRSPVYPVFLAGSYLLFGQQILAVRLVEALLGSGLAIVIAIIAKRVGGEGVGALAGLLWSIYPTGVFIVGLVYPTHLATLLLACAVLCLIPQRDSQLTTGKVLIGGICFGIAALTVPAALATVAVASVWIVYWQPAHRLMLTSVLLLGVSLVFVPWTMRNFHVYDRFVLVEPRVVELLPSMQADRTVTDPPQRAGGQRGLDKISAIVRNPGAFAERFVREFGYFWELYPQRLYMNRPTFRENMHREDSRIVRQTIFGTSWTALVSVLAEGPIFLLGLIGIGAMWFSKERRRALSLLCLIILSFAVGYSFFWGKMRYRIPIEPYLIILCAYGLRHIWLARPGRFAPAPAPAARIAAEP